MNVYTKKNGKDRILQPLTCHKIHGVVKISCYRCQLHTQQNPGTLTERA